MRRLEYYFPNHSGIVVLLTAFLNAVWTSFRRQTQLRIPVELCKYIKLLIGKEPKAGFPRALYNREEATSKKSRDMFYKALEGCVILGVAAAFSSGSGYCRTTSKASPNIDTTPHWVPSAESIRSAIFYHDRALSATELIRMISSDLTRRINGTDDIRVDHELVLHIVAGAIMNSLDTENLVAEDVIYVLSFLTMYAQSQTTETRASLVEWFTNEGQRSFDEIGIYANETFGRVVDRAHSDATGFESSNLPEQSMDPTTEGVEDVEIQTASPTFVEAVPRVGTRSGRSIADWVRTRSMGQEHNDQPPVYDREDQRRRDQFFYFGRQPEDPVELPTPRVQQRADYTRIHGDYFEDPDEPLLPTPRRQRHRAVRRSVCSDSPDLRTTPEAFTVDLRPIVVSGLTSDQLEAEFARRIGLPICAPTSTTANEDVQPIIHETGDAEDVPEEVTTPVRVAEGVTQHGGPAPATERDTEVVDSYADPENHSDLYSIGGDGTQSDHDSAAEDESQRHVSLAEYDSGSEASGEDERDSSMDEERTQHDQQTQGDVVADTEAAAHYGFDGEPLEEEREQESDEKLEEELAIEEAPRVRRRDALWGWVKGALGFGRTTAESAPSDEIPAENPKE